MPSSPTVADALVRYLASQRASGAPACAGVFTIFGHGNVAGLGSALARAEIPVYRAHNEQAMGLAAVAFAKATGRRRFMACTTSIGPGATNLVTAAATARVNRLPMLLLPGDAFATRRVDPVLQQLEVEGDPHVTVNDCLRPVSVYFDRIVRPEQLAPALERAMEVLFDPVRTGPVTLCLPQDVQAEALELPEAFFAPRERSVRRPPPDPTELTRAADAIRAAERAVIIAGGGVRYARAEAELASFANGTNMPVVETPAGRGSAVGPRSLGGVGVTGTGPANRAIREADVILAVGTRLTDFTTGSRSLFGSTPVVHLNVDPRDATKLGGTPLIADAALGLFALQEALVGFESDREWRQSLDSDLEAWWSELRSEDDGSPLSDGAVIDVVADWATRETIVVAASGSIPGELQKRWRPRHPNQIHLEYGFSCMGYEIAGALGVKLARPDDEVVALVGDGAYLMLNSELQTSVALGKKLIVVVFDNGGFGCIHRLQRSVGSPSYANLRPGPDVDFVAHARSLGCVAERATDRPQLSAALERARTSTGTSVIVVPTDPNRSTDGGGAPWEVPHPGPARGNGA